MTSFRRRYDVHATSHRLPIDVEMTLSVYGDATLQNNKLRQKYFSRILSNGAKQLSCKKKFWRTPISYSAFCRTLFKECFSLVLIKKILKVPDSSSWVLQCTAC